MGSDEHLRKAFDFFDKDKNGYLEIEELRDALADEIDENNEDVINSIIHDVDTDKAQTGGKHHDNIQESDTIISV
ncbi:hypothetical protein Leryth_012230 [Lithospermum erythrorhizon]|nr:hypothetical protein Leryth_012230 [Lithospermum erythrorhizon]